MHGKDSAPAVLLAAKLLRINTSIAMTVPVDQVVICGWTGRDARLVSRHADELAALGVARPSRIPCYYRAAAALLTTSRSIQVVGAETSGEVEPVLIGNAAGILVSVGSDHTDRLVESYSIAIAKQLCAKPLAVEFWLLSDVLPHWDKLVLRSFAVVHEKRRLYQESQMTALWRPDTLIADYFGPGNQLAEATAMFCGTVPAIDGIVPAQRFEIELLDPVLKRTITHGYDIVSLPVVS
jgi:hypothetical protein